MTRGLQAGGRIGHEAALAHQIAVQPAHGRHAPRHTGRGAVAAGAGEVAVHVVVSGLKDRARRRGGGEEGGKARQIAPVGGDSVWTQGALELDVGEVLLEGRVGRRRTARRVTDAGGAATGRSAAHVDATAARSGVHPVVAAATCSRACSNR